MVWSAPKCSENLRASPGPNGVDAGVRAAAVVVYALVDVDAAVRELVQDEAHPTRTLVAA